MAESTEDSKTLVQLEEESEGNRIGNFDFIFRKIGGAVPLKPSDASFELETAPSRALAVSERFHVLFLAHSEGFYVAKTKDTIELAKKIKEQGKGSGSIQELSVVDVPIGRVSILALSTDSSTLAACVGGDVHLFSVVSLLNKVKEPSFSCSLGESSHAKDLRWRKNEKNSYVVLSSHGKLYYGDLESPLKDAMDGVDAVDWSVKGDYIAVAKENTLRILSPDFKEQFCMLLLFRPSITKVDSIKWVRSDSIIIGCLQLTDDGEEEGYMVQVVTNNKDENIEVSSKPIAISFGDLFTSLDHEIPFGTGPYLFLSYLERWELVLASNRKNTSEHIVLLGWSLNGILKEVAAIAFVQEKDIPWIELPENGDDNLIVGFGVDKVSLYEKIEFMESHGELKELSPYCVLLCLTSDGKLIMFHAARISDPSVLPIVPPGDVTSVGGEFPSLMSQEPTIDSGIETSLVVEKSSMTSKVVVDINKDHSIFTEKGPSVTELRESMKFPSLSGQISDSEANGSSVASDSGSKGNYLMVASNKEPKYLVSSGIYSSGKLSDTRASSFGSVHSEEQENIGTVAGKTTVVPSIQTSPYSFLSSNRNSSSKDPRVSSSPSVLFPSKPIQSEEQKTAITGARTSDYASSHSIPSSSREESKPGKSHISKGTPFLENSRTQRSPLMLDSELQVSEMVKELDSLLLDIEGEGGFKDACTVFQKHSVLEIEAGLENLSESCRFSKNMMEVRLGDIQDLLDKTMQVLARKIHVEGIAQQASNSQYWELWNCQRLSPEFELKRRQILKLNQNIVNQIIELERHFNALELNKFGDKGGVPMGRRAFHSSPESSRQTQSLHSLYNTMNSQLAAAEQLSECLSKQMAVLNIESPPVKKQGAAKALFESIGLTYDGDSFRSPDANRADYTPDSIKKLPPSSFSAAIKEHSRRNASDSLKGIEPETARRRRDSLDRSLARFEPQRTTVKRMLLEERSKVSASKSIGIGKEMFNSPTGDGFSVSHRMDRIASSLPSLPPTTNKNHPNTNQSNEDIQGKSSTQASISPSFPLFKWAKDKVGASQPVGSVFPSMQQRVITLPLSTEVVTSLASAVDNNAKENMGSTRCSSISESFVAQSNPSAVQNISIYERTSIVQSETPNETVPRVSSTGLPTKPASQRKTVHIKTQPSDFSNTKNGGFIQPTQTAGNINVGARTLESSFSIQQKSHTSLLASRTNSPSRVKSGETTTSSSTSSSPLSFSPPFPPSTFSSSASSESSSSSIPASASSSSDSSLLAMPSGGSVPSKVIDKTVPPPTLTSVSTSFPSSPFSFQTQKQQVSLPIPSTENVVLQSPFQPEVRDALSKLGPAQPASEISGSLSSESQPISHTVNSINNFGGSPSAPMNSQPEASSTASVMFPAQSASTTEEKTQALDATVTEEDEMEEEAPETTGLSLGALGGFGLGPTPAPSAPKSNPFGVPFGAAAVSPASSPFPLTVPSGELFRPASFSLSSSTSPQSSQPMSHSGFSGFSTGSNFAPSTGSGFGQPAQVGAGQKALGSVLGAFGQSRQLGPGLPGMGFASSSGFGGGGGGFSAAAMSGGFGSGAGFAGASTGGGFAGAARGGGFAGASTSGGFAGAATIGGFAGMASAGGGFAGAASASGGFAAAAAAGGGFAGGASGAPTGGFGAFSSSGGSSRPPELFTQMRR